MTLLLDENLALSYAEALRREGFAAKHVIKINYDQTKDELIVNFARTNNMVIVTFDLDHTKIVALSGGILPSVITFRLTQISQEILLAFFTKHYTTIQPALEKGALITVDDNGIRIRELPIRR
jgi:predicted nuclease of predicted toxin-antitoxin system